MNSNPSSSLTVLADLDEKTPSRVMPMTAPRTMLAMMAGCRELFCLLPDSVSLFEPGLDSSSTSDSDLSFEALVPASVAF